MSIMSVSEVRSRLAEAIELARDEPVTVSRRGRRQVVLVDPEQFDRLTEAAEELADITAFDEAMSESGENIPWEQVKADLGWV
jgi:prevent-host-death family protein